MKIDFRPRCKRCGKVPRGRRGKESLKLYAPFCSFHCKEWAQLEAAQRYINEKYYSGKP